MNPKIAIVGAGPAGAATALFALREGVAASDLVLYDAARFPRKKLCGGGLTFRGTEIVDALLEDAPAPYGARTVGLDFRAKTGEVKVRERGPQRLFDRALLDDALVRRCKAAGVEIREGERVLGLERGAFGTKLRLPNGLTEAYALVVGADGARSSIRREMGLPEGLLGRLVEAVYTTEEPWDDARLLFDFDPVLEGIPGYLWIFPYPLPDGERRYKIGIMDGRGVTAGELLRERTARFAEAHGMRPLESKIAGWPERYFDRKLPAHVPGVFLTGEAWGIDPLLGEGIAPAYYMGEYTARRLRECLDRGTDTLPDYERAFKRTDEGKNLVFQSFLADRLSGRNGARWLSVLFENATLRELAGAGTEAYGRLRGRAPRLVLSYLVSRLTAPFRRRPALPGST
jgi:menaquinone-9 beta-reductase